MKHHRRSFPARGLFTLLVILAFFLPAPAVAQGGAWDRGILWKIEGGGAAPSWLFGTMHSADPEIATPPQAVRRILDAVDSLTIEVIVDQQTQMELSQSMLLPQGVLLGDIAGPDMLQRAVTVGAAYGLPGAVVQRFQPWALYTIYSLPPSEMQRQAAGEMPLDKVLEFLARERGIPVHALEAPGEQIAALADYSQEQQLVILDFTMALNPFVEDFFDAMKQAWLAGELGELNAIKQDMERDAPADLVNDFDGKMIYERNHRMAERMAPRLAEGNALVAVGAMHLYGPQGIPALLGAQGYKVTPVQ